MKNIFTFKFTRLVLSIGTLGLATVAMTILGSMGTAFADDVPGNGSFAVQGGALSVGITAPTFSSAANGGGTIYDGTTHTFVLNGTQQNVYIDLPITMVDASGSGNGWSLNIAATSFSGSGHSLNNMPAVTGVDTLTKTDASSSSATSTVSITSTTLVPQYSSDTASTTSLVNVPAGQGMGSYRTTIHMQLVIDAKDYAAASYTSTFYVDHAAPLSS